MISSTDLKKRKTTENEGGEKKKPNAGVIDAWNTVLFDKFVRFQKVLIEGLGNHGTACVELYPPPKGAKILDVGCGFGDLTITLAKGTGSNGQVTGIDCAERFVQSGRQRAIDLKQPNAVFEVRDAQFDNLGGPYDAAYARFGTMFFSSPVAAFRNIRKSLKPGARFAFSVWRKREDNACFYEAQLAVEKFITEDQLDRSMNTCGPGPFSQAGPDMVSDQLLAAGFEQVTFTRFDADMCVGESLDNALEFAANLGPAGEKIRLASAQATDEQKQAIGQALRDALKKYVRPDGSVWATSSTWLISVLNPDPKKK